jgi:hypothetical protein
MTVILKRKPTKRLASTYVSGPMTGLPEMNTPEFFRQEERWAALGWRVLNPARFNPDFERVQDGNLIKPGSEESRAFCIWHDLEAVRETDAITIMGGWEKSIGARDEIFLARSLRHPIFEAEDGREIIIDRHVCDRNVVYSDSLILTPTERLRSAYLSGPMTGLAEQNYPEFFAFEERWSAAGWQVLNPARFNPSIEIHRKNQRLNLGSEGSRAASIWHDLEAIRETDVIIALPGWEHSIGARAELYTARALRHPIIDGLTGREINLDAHVCNYDIYVVTKKVRTDYFAAAA